MSIPSGCLDIQGGTSAIPSGVRLWGSELAMNTRPARGKHWLLLYTVMGGEAIEELSERKISCDDDAWAFGQGLGAGGNWKGMGIRGYEVFGKQCPCLYKDGFACWGRPPIPVNSPLPGAGCAFGSRTLGASLQHRWSPACPSILAHLVSKKPPTSMKISDCPKIQTPLFHLLPVSGTISTRRRDQWRRAAIRN